MRDDLADDRRERGRADVAEDAALDLGAGDELLHEHLLVVPAGERDGGFELGLVVRLRDPDGGAEARRLDEDGIAERVPDLVAEPQRLVPRDRDAAVAQDRLEQVLVHAERRGRDAGADVGDAGELEQALDGAVLAERAVQHGQDDVDGAERLGRLRVGEDGETLCDCRTSPSSAASPSPGPRAQRPSRPIAIVVVS